MDIGNCPEDGKRYYVTDAGRTDGRCQSCQTSKNCKYKSIARALKEETIDDEKRRILEAKDKYRAARHTGICPNCNKPLYQPRLNIESLDVRKCEETKADEACYISGTICKNVKLASQYCRTIEPGRSWAKELQQRIRAGKIAPGPYHRPDGTLNVYKANNALRKEGLPTVTGTKSDELDYGELYRARRAFLESYDVHRRQKRAYCSPSCKREYELAHQNDDIPFQE